MISSTLQQLRYERSSGRWLLLTAVTIALGLLVFRLPLPVAAAAIVFPAVVLLILRFPLAGLSLTLILGPFGALEGIVLDNPLLDSGQLLLLLTFASWMAAALARRRIWLPRTPINIPLLLFLLVATLSLLAAPSTSLGLREMLKWIEMSLIMYMVIDLATDGGRSTVRLRSVARQVLIALLLAGLIQAAIGIWQFGLRDTGPEHFEILGRYYRAYGTFEQPNPFGGYVNLSALLAIGVTWGLLVQTWHIWRAKYDVVQEVVLRPIYFWLPFAALCGLTGTAAVVFSWSRGAWLGLLAGLTAVMLFSARRWWPGFLFLIAGVVGVLGFVTLGAAAGVGPAQSAATRLTGFVDDFSLGDVRGVDITTENFAVLERLAHWQAAVGMAQEDILLGAGFGNYEAAYSQYALINWPNALGHAHNYYLNLLAEIGAVGLLAYLVLWLVIVWQTVCGLRSLSWPDRGILLGLLGAWTALSVHHVVDKLYVNNIYIHLGAMLGLLQLLVWPRGGSEEKGPQDGQGMNRIFFEQQK